MSDRTSKPATTALARAFRGKCGVLAAMAGVQRLRSRHSRQDLACRTARRFQRVLRAENTDRHSSYRDVPITLSVLTRLISHEELGNRAYKVLKNSMNELMPHLSRFDALDEIVKRWENFTYGTLKSPAIRNDLRARQGSRCAACGEPINPAEEHVHHVTYVNLCYTSFNVKGIPPCGSCEVKARCLDRLAAVHGSCHDVIHEKSSEERQATFEGDTSKVRFPRSRSPWTTNDEMQLNVLLASKKRMSSIAIALGRSSRAVRLHMDRIGIGEAKKSAASTTTAQPAKISPALRKSSTMERSGVIPARHGKTWDTHEVNEITDGILQGESIASLARRLQRKESGVVSKLYAISRTRADVQAKLLEAGWPELHKDYRQVLEKLRAPTVADEEN